MVPKYSLLTWYWSRKYSLLTWYRYRIDKLHTWYRYTKDALLTWSQYSQHFRLSVEPPCIAVLPPLFLWLHPIQSFRRSPCKVSRILTRQFIWTYVDSVAPYRHCQLKRAWDDILKENGQCCPQIGMRERAGLAGSILIAYLRRLSSDASNLFQCFYELPFMQIINTINLALTEKSFILFHHRR